jgi:predicted DNA-binding transcriptional regulator AlpA
MGRIRGRNKPEPADGDQSVMNRSPTSPVVRRSLALETAQMKVPASIHEHDSLADSANLAERLAATLLDSAALLSWLGISRGHLNHLIAEHGFPQPIRLSRRNYRIIAGWSSMSTIG